MNYANFSNRLPLNRMGGNDITDGRTKFAIDPLKPKELTTIQNPFIKTTSKSVATTQTTTPATSGNSSKPTALDWFNSGSNFLGNLTNSFAQIKAAQAQQKIAEQQAYTNQLMAQQGGLLGSNPQIRQGSVSPMVWIAILLIAVLLVVYFMRK